MSLYRCAACGSPNVITDTQIGGLKYDYLKGAVGTAILGAGGAAAGIKNQQQQVFKCPDCGQTLTYAMPDEIKQTIDMGILSEEARKNAVIQGVPISWDVLTAKYKNIGEISDVKESRPSSAKAELMEYFSFDFMSDAGKLLLEAARPQFEETKASFKQQLEERQQAQANKDAQDFLDCNKLREKLKTEIENLKTELGTLGFFQFGKKNELKEKIEKSEAELEKTMARGRELFKKLGTKDEKVDDAEVTVYAALKAIGHEAVPKQVYQAVCYYTNRSYSNRDNGQVVTGVRLRQLHLEGIINRGGDTYLEYPNAVSYYVE